jgi:D-tagatose-1,6-bisphosphate aldolase subunit GatZ/KbaZ
MDVIRAVLLRTAATATPILIESTSNQVNQFGGYTGMTPSEFANAVFQQADTIGLPRELIVIGGDHLGPLPWADLDELHAMRHAEELVTACIQAGYSKIHLDTSMRLADDSLGQPLKVETCARRGAQLCRVAENAFAAHKRANPHAETPVYVIGSEVPVPGGSLRLEESCITRAESAFEAYEAYRAAFFELGLEAAFERVVALVVNLGIEFHEFSISEYNRVLCADLTTAMKELPLCIEAHSTDFQILQNLKHLCEDRVAILKVGPALTFALREALFALEQIELELFRDNPEAVSGFRAVLDDVMLADTYAWKDYYTGTENQQRIARAYSFLDRCRYYLNQPPVVKARDRLIANLDGNKIPLSLLSQALPAQYYRVRNGTIRNEPLDIIMDHIGDRIDIYTEATNIRFTMDRLSGK